MKKVITTTLIIAALASCQKSDQTTSEMVDMTEVTFTSGISTRASDTSWDAEDKIGVFMYNSDDSDICNDTSSNVEYTLALGAGGSEATFTSENPLLYPESNDVDFMAYHPYTEALEGSTVSLGTTDQSSETKLKAQDFMVASATGYNKNSDSPLLSFTRKMSKIVINITRKESRANAVLSNITLMDVIVDGTYIIANQKEENTVIEGKTEGDITLFENESSTIEAIIIPQTISSAMFMLAIDGETYLTTISGTFENNKQYSYDLTIGSDKVEFVKGTITNWTETDNGELSTTKVTDISYNSETDTYEIRTGNGLRAFSDLTNGYECFVIGLVTDGDDNGTRFNFGEINESINGKLMADIDLEGIDDEGNGIAENEFTVICSLSSLDYNGTFDGDGHIIKGLYINQPELDYQGFIGRTYFATIKNLGVSGNITGYQYVGGIAAFIRSSTIENCYFEGSAKALGINIGGISGFMNASTINNCYNRGDIEGEVDFTGGIIGTPYDSSIQNSYNAGSITGIAYSSGGITGYYSDSSTITYCYYDKNVATGVSSAIPTEDNSIDCCGLTTEEMKGDATTYGTLLYYLTNSSYGASSSWIADTENINDGYPILTWQQVED